MLLFPWAAKLLCAMAFCCCFILILIFILIIPQICLEMIIPDRERKPHWDFLVCEADAVQKLYCRKTGRKSRTASKKSSQSTKKVSHSTKNECCPAPRKRNAGSRVVQSQQKVSGAKPRATATKRPPQSNDSEAFVDTALVSPAATAVDVSKFSTDSMAQPQSSSTCPLVMLATPCISGVAPVSGVVPFSVKTLTGKSFSISMPLSATFGSLKGKLSALNGVPVERQRLIYRGRNCDDKESLGAWGVGRDSTVYLVIRPS